mgnify:CR=1 FL=1
MEGHFFKQEKMTLGGSPAHFLTVCDRGVLKLRSPAHAAGERGSEPKEELRATHPHALGAKMTVIKQTPSNYLEIANLNRACWLKLAISNNHALFVFLHITYDILLVLVGVEYPPCPCCSPSLHVPSDRCKEYKCSPFKGPSHTYQTRTNPITNPSQS